MISATVAVPDLPQDFGNASRNVFSYITAAIRQGTKLSKKIMTAFVRATSQLDDISPIFRAVANPVKESANKITTMLMGVGFAVYDQLKNLSETRTLRKMRARQRRERIEALYFHKA